LSVETQDARRTIEIKLAEIDAIVGGRIWGGKF